MSNGDSIEEFGEDSTWQAAGNRSLKAAAITILLVDCNRLGEFMTERPDTLTVRGATHCNQLLEL